MANPIFHSQYTAQQIEDLITNGAPIVQNGHWWRWDIDAGAWTDTGITADSETAATEAEAARDEARALVGGAKSVIVEAFPHEAVNGAAVSFDDGANNVPFASLVIPFDAVQSGTGTPALDNIRAISGFSAVNVTVKATAASQDGTVYAVAFGAAGTVYGGVLSDNGDGTWTLTITHGFRSFDGTEDWVPNGSSNQKKYFTLSVGENGTVVDDDSICSHCVDNPGIKAGNLETGYRVWNRSAADATVLFRLSTVEYQTLEDFTDYLAAQYGLGTPVQVCYRLSESGQQTVVLTADSVKTLLGNNYITTDVGEMDAVYCADPALYIAKQIAASVEDAIEEAY